MYIFKVLFLFLMVLNITYAHNEYLEPDEHNHIKPIPLTSEESTYLKNKKEIKICIDPDWFPFEKINEMGKHIGISSDYFRIFSKQLQTNITLVKTETWTQTLNYLKKRKCDVLTLGNETPKRKEYLNFTKPYLTVPFVIATKSEQHYVDDIKYLKNKVIAVVKNNALISVLRQMYPNLIIKEVQNSKEGLELVQDNKVYGFAANMLSISYILQSEYMNDMKIMNKLDNNNSNLAIGVRNDEPILLQLFEKLVATLSEEIKHEILNKYMAIKYEQNITNKYLYEIIAVIVLISLIVAFIQFKQKQLNDQLEKKVKERTEQLLQQNRLAQMGEMLSMIAHQWRQPLAAISAVTNSLMIKSMLDHKISNKDLQKEISYISDYSQHLSITIDDFRNFFKPDKEKITTTLEKIIDNSISITKNSLKSKGINIEIAYNCNKELKVYSTEISQAVLNIIKNAEDAFLENHIINSLVTTRDIVIRTYSEDNNAIIEIEDNAGGIPSSIIDKIFDPYFSTKNSKDGTGLGLYMSKIIIDEHCNGKLSAKNTKNGALFTISIPLI